MSSSLDAAPPVHPIARVAGALHVVLGMALLIAVAASFLPDPPPPPGERHYGGGSWGWVFMIFLIPPGVVIVGIGVALWRGWLRLGFLVGEIVLVVGGYTYARFS